MSSMKYQALMLLGLFLMALPLAAAQDVEMTVNMTLGDIFDLCALINKHLPYYEAVLRWSTQSLVIRSVGTSSRGWPSAVYSPRLDLKKAMPEIVVTHLIEMNEKELGL